MLLASPHGKASRNMLPARAKWLRDRYVSRSAAFFLSYMTAKDWAEFDAFMEAKRRMVELRKKNPYIVDLMRVLAA